MNRSAQLVVTVRNRAPGRISEYAHMPLAADSREPSKLARLAERKIRAEYRDRRATAHYSVTDDSRPGGETTLVRGTVEIDDLPGERESAPAERNRA